MALKKVDTEHFSDVELKAKSLAEQVSALKSTLSGANTAVLQSWQGDGRTGYEDLYYVVFQQLADISREFWEIYDALCNAESSFLEGDMDAATNVVSMGS